MNLKTRAGRRKPRWAALGVATVTAVALAWTAFSSAGVAQSNDDLSTVIAAMNSKAASFQSVQADIEWETYNRAVEETELQTGKSYFRRKGKDLEALLDIEKLDGKPVPKQFLYRDGVVSFYEPKINRVTTHVVGKSKADVDAAMSLGFGGTGDDLLTSYDVKFVAWEVLDGVRTAKLELVSKNPHKGFNKAVIWIDPARDIAVQQQFFNKEDYRLIRYRKIKYNGKISDGEFKLRTHGSPEIVTQ